MKPAEFWQNFQLGTEQEIACNFIYDGLRNLHEMDTLNMETEVFPVLYNLSVGIERLLKVAVVLLEFNDQTDIATLEKKLKTHNHIVLLDRIRAHKEMNLGKNHMALLELLSGFYGTQRYDRFSLKSIDDLSKEKKSLHMFLKKFLEIDIHEDIFGVPNSLRIREFIGRTVKKITKRLYAIIQDEASAKNLYTYEISGSSAKAAKILWGDESIVFEGEEIAAIEIIAFFLKTEDSHLINAIKGIAPLDLDPALSSDYLQFLLKGRTEATSVIMDEIQVGHERIDKLGERLGLIKALKSPGAFSGEE